MPLTPLKHILLIDNDEDEFEFLASAVEEIDRSVTVHFVSKCDRLLLASLPMPDLIFLDINMPEYDGFHWLEGIRGHGYRDVPIIMYTTSRNQSQVDRAFESGANLFITKPNKSRDLVAILQELFLQNWGSPAEVTSAFHERGAYHLCS
ncbi:MAG TPA: response regulator [Flavisolibacter sp.]|nr:response regulator [Flavisolibacter sp.]